MIRLRDRFDGSSEHKLDEMYQPITSIKITTWLLRPLDINWIEWRLSVS